MTQIKTKTMHVKKGDKVIVITGKDKSKSGVVVRSFPKLEKVLIDGVNMKKVHKKKRRENEKGKVVEVAAPIHVSNVKKVKS